MHNINVNTTVYPPAPTPLDNPAIIANKIYAMSFGSPGALLKRIILNAPAKLNAAAMSLPINIIKSDTTRGNRTIVNAKFAL